jgi:uncharacterized membrane protein
MSQASAEAVGWSPAAGGRSRRRWAPRAVAAALFTSGVVHLVRPSVFEPMIPTSMPGPKEIVYLSGIAELICAVGLFKRARWAGPASVAVLLAVWPGNLQMALDVTAASGPDDTAKVALVWARLPLQIPMMWAVMQDREQAAR